MVRINNDLVVGWFDHHKGKLTYSMTGSRNGADGTADCSGSITQAIYEAGAPKYDYLYSTVTLGSWLASIGYTRISENQDWDAQRGDIVLMSWSWGMAGSGGAGGHVGVMKNDKTFISTDYWTGGEVGTAVSEHDWNYYYNVQAPVYIEVWRQLDGDENPQPTEPAMPVPDHGVSAIGRFKAVGGEYAIYQDVKVDEVKFHNGIWQFVNYDMAGGRDIDWNNNGVPLAIVTRTDGGDNNNVGAGATVKFDAPWNNGYIDQYDEASNGVGVVYGDYGMIWFNADWLLQA